MGISPAQNSEQHHQHHMAIREMRWTEREGDGIDLNMKTIIYMFYGSTDCQCVS